MSLSCTTVQWRGLTLASDHSSPFGIRTLLGWDELPDARLDAPARPQAHGRFDTAVWADERIITLSGQIVSQDRDALLQELQGVMGWPTGLSAAEDLVVARGGRELTGFARLTAFKTPTTVNWSVGEVPFVIEWRCRDPLRYGAVEGVYTPFPTRSGGLRFPLYSDLAGANVGALDYGPPSTTGRLVLSNPGTADSWPQFNIDGPVAAEGFEIVTVGTGARLRFEGGVPAGSSLVLDASTGTAVIDGDADRGGLLTWRDWAPIPAGGSSEFAFIPLGATSSAVLTASVRPAFW